MTYVAGEKYQAFIPMLVYSCYKAYPEYDIMLFLHEQLRQDIKNTLLQTRLYDKVTIRENVFRRELPRITALQSKSCRWVLWDDLFNQYDYLYIVDIDMFYIREPQPLHLQHSERMKMTGLPFDNMRRTIKLTRNLATVLYRIKQSGLHNFGHFMFNKNVVEEKLSGLHFVNVKEYYSAENFRIINEVKQRLFRRYFFPEILTSNNEVLLANIVKQMGYDISRLGMQTDSIKSLSFTDIYRPEFRPHHGFHLGIFRAGIVKDSKNDPILDSETYRYYLQRYLDLIKEDDYKVFYNNLPLFAKTYIDQLHSYYNINFSYE